MSTYKKNTEIKLKNENQMSDYWRERTIFPGAVPKEVKILIKDIQDIDKSIFRKLIKVALGTLQGTISPEKFEVVFENLCKIKNCKNEDDVLELSTYYSGVLSLLRAVLKINLKTVGRETLMQDLKDLGFSEEFSVDVCQVAFGPASSEIMNEVINNNPHLPKLEDLHWSVDVALSNTWCSKILEPCVSLTMRTSDGDVRSFELPLHAFHLLRQSTAAMMRQMEALERRK